MKLIHTKALAALTLAGIMSVTGSVCAMADADLEDTGYAGYNTYAEYMASHPEQAPQKVTALRWEGSKLYWSGSANSLQYEVEIMHNDTVFISTIVTGTEYYMGSASYPSGTYKARVRGLGSQAYAGEWCEYTTPRYMGSFKRETSASNAQAQAATRYVQSGMGTPGWNHDANGYWYCNTNMTFTANGWQQIDSKWYFFDGNGYLHNGWLEYNNNWYYITGDGMATGLVTIGGSMYYFDASTGIMLSNAYTPDGHYADINGVVK